MLPPQCCRSLTLSSGSHAFINQIPALSAVSLSAARSTFPPMTSPQPWKQRGDLKGAGGFKRKKLKGRVVLPGKEKGFFLIFFVKLELFFFFLVDSIEAW